MISIQQIQYILALADERQFQRASDRCYVTQPTLSMQLKKAEESLGTQIFDRSKQPIDLTAFGKRLIPVLRDVMQEYDKINKVVEEDKGVYRTHLKIGIIPTVGGYLIPDLFNEWKKVLTNVQLSIEEMKTEEVIVALEEGKIDVGIMAGPLVRPKWRTSVLYQEEIKAFMPSVKEDRVRPEFLVDHQPWLLTEGNCLRTQMVHFCNVQSSDDLWSYEGGSIQLLEKMVKENGGYTLVPQGFIGKNSKDYKKIESTTGEYPAREIIGICSRKTDKWEVIEKVIRSIQLRYPQARHELFTLLNWK